MKTLYQAAKEKVENSHKLSPHKDFVLADWEVWPDEDKHYQWLIDTNEDEILDWVEETRRITAIVKSQN